MIPQPDKQEIPYSINIIITENNGFPQIELRKRFRNEDIIKQIVSCALNEQPIIILPTFSDKMRALASLVDKGIMIKKENSFYFL